MTRERGGGGHKKRGKNGSGKGRTTTNQFIQLGRQRYEVIERLSLPDRGRWLVRDFRPHPKGTLYVAIILPDSEATAQLRKSLHRLPKHANSLPSLIDHGRLDDRYCLIIDWWEGIDFFTYLNRVSDRKTPRPSPTECVRLFRGLAHSLLILHDACRVVHGDLKPANLVLTVLPSSLRMIDFGSSWQLERNSSRLPGDGSDPTFSAPELFAHNSPVNTSSDQFSLGVILYQALTLSIPFEGLGGKVGHPDFRSEFQNSESELVVPSTLIDSLYRLPKSINDELDRLLQTLLQIDPKKRFPNSRAMTDAFDRLYSLIQSKRFEEPDSSRPTDGFEKLVVQLTKLFRRKERE